MTKFQADLTIALLFLLLSHDYSGFSQGVLWVIGVGWGLSAGSRIFKRET